MIGSKFLSRTAGAGLTILMLCFATASFAFEVHIDSAISVGGYSLTVKGSVDGQGHQPATNITVDVLPPTGSPIRVVTNYAIPPTLPSNYTWSGGLPNNAQIPIGSKVQVWSNRQSNAILPITFQPQPPVVSQMSTNPGPGSVAGVTPPRCFDGPDGAPVNICPVVLYNGLTFWPLSYRDNRFSIALVATDASGTVKDVQELAGARYAYKITIDASAQTITVYGQSNQTASTAWANLK